MWLCSDLNIITIIIIIITIIKGSLPVLNSLMDYLLLFVYRVTEKLLGVIHKFE